MAVKYNILFPKGTMHNLDHYVKVHMPLIEKHLPGQLLKWEVATFPEDAPFMVVCHAELTSDEAFNSLHGSEAGKEVFADVPNFATQRPLFLKETPFARSSR